MNEKEGGKLMEAMDEMYDSLKNLIEKS